VGFVDPSGGSGGDSFTIAVAHREGDRHVLDAVRERKPPLSPDSVIKEYAAFLKSYGIQTVVGDMRYSAMFTVEGFYGTDHVSALRADEKRNLP
jgi:hypothetical protein